MNIQLNTKCFAVIAALVLLASTAAPALAAPAAGHSAPSPARGIVGEDRTRPQPAVITPAAVISRTAATLRDPLGAFQPPLIVTDPASPAPTGTLLPEAQPISADNLLGLTNVARWGYGTLQAVDYADDGRFFVAGGPHGLAVYDAFNLQAPPRWVPLEPPVYYDTLTLSTDGKYVLLEGYRQHETHSLADGSRQPLAQGLHFLPASTLVQSRDKLRSPSGAFELRLSSDYRPDPDYLAFGYQISVRAMHSGQTREHLYDLGDPTMQVEYADRASAEGCDLYVFSPCGNALEPAAMTPYQVAFSPAEDSLAILYRPGELGSSTAFSVLKIYDTADGQLMQVLGDYSHAIRSFAYAPNGRQLLVGYGDGSVTLWDLTTDAMTFGARHFNGSVYDLAFTPDSSLLLLKTPGRLDVRRASDGLLWQRLTANSFAVSPVDNRIALGQRNGDIRVLDLDTGLSETDLDAHDGAVFALAFSEDGTLLASAGGDCRVAAWEALGGELQHLYADNVTAPYGDFTGPSRIFIKTLTFLPDTNQLVGYGSWARVASWNEDTGDGQYLIEPEPLDYFQGMQTLKPHFPQISGLDRAHNTLVVDGINYDLATGEATGAYEPPDTLAAGCYPFGQLSADGQLLFTRGYDARRGQVCILNAADLSLRAALEVMPDTDTAPRLLGFELSPDGRQLAVMVEGGRVYIYQAL
jgi:WD40 repeat protein